MSEFPRTYFVYGSLRPGARFWGNIERFVIDYAPGVLRGWNLYHLPDGYPAITPGAGQTFGDVIFIARGLEADMAGVADDIEDYNPLDPGSLYIRTTVDVELLRSPGAAPIPAATYVFNESRLPFLLRKGIEVADGDWATWLAEREER